MVYEYILVVQAMDKNVPTSFQYVSILLLSCANLVFFAWIFLAIAFIMRNLKQGGQTVKRQMYKNLSIILIISVVLSIAVFMLQISLEWLNLVDSLWKVWWIWEFYWELQYLVVLATIAIIWRPTGNNKRYAYAQQIDSTIGEIQLEDVSAGNSDTSEELDVQHDEQVQ